MSNSYTLDLKWAGKTDDPRTYDRSYILSSNGKTDITGSADPLSRGDPKKWNPEEMLLASLSSCQMLWYLYLCAKAKIVVTQYTDHPKGILTEEGKSAFAEATLSPQIVITDSSHIDEATALLSKAHENCLIANSINFKVKIEGRITANDD